jgi:hypothetical protein
MDPTRARTNSMHTYAFESKNFWAASPGWEYRITSKQEPKGTSCAWDTISKTCKIFHEKWTNVLNKKLVWCSIWINIVASNHDTTSMAGHYGNYQGDWGFGMIGPKNILPFLLKNFLSSQYVIFNTHKDCFKFYIFRLRTISEFESSSLRPK